MNKKKKSCSKKKKNLFFCDSSFLLWQTNSNKLTEFKRQKPAGFKMSAEVWIKAFVKSLDETGEPS